MEEKEFKQKLNDWITKEPSAPSEEELEFANEQRRIATGRDEASGEIIAYLNRKKLNYGKSEAHFIKTIIRYIEKNIMHK
jgi:hypothetical protein